jgi:two-component system, OmpR family, KDP operon response regulator KdpE
MNKPVVLVIDDEIQIRRFLRAGFEREDFSVREAATGAAALGAAGQELVDLVIVDLGLPDIDGSEIVQWLRTWSTAPIIVLSVRSSEDEKVRLLDLGADGYVVKPFSMEELLARARAALRREARRATGQAIVHAGPLSINLEQRNVHVKGKEVQLSPKEYRLLQALAQRAGNVVTDQHLLKAVWGVTHLEDAHYLRIVIRKIRRKIEEDPTRPRILVTELGIGYRLA